MCRGKKKEDSMVEIPVTPNGELFHAAATGDNEKVKAAVAKGADVNVPEEEKSDDVDFYSAADYPLHVAAEGGFVETVKLLFFVGKEGANTENKNRLGNTALHRAISHGHLDVVNELLTRGANIHTANKIGNTALHIASYCGHLEIAARLLEEGAAKDIKIPNKVNMTPLDYAKKVEMKKILSVAAGGTGVSTVHEGEDDKKE